MTSHREYTYQRFHRPWPANRPADLAEKSTPPGLSDQDLFLRITTTGLSPPLVNPSAA